MGAQTAPATPPSGRDTAPDGLLGRRHALFGTAVAGLVFGAAAGALHGDPSSNPYAVVAIPCVVAGIAAAPAAGGFGAANAEIRSKGNLYRAAEAIVARNRDFLFDNPRVAASSVVRRALLPTDGDLDALRFSPSMAAELRDFREGRGHLMGGASRSGARYFLARPGAVGAGQGANLPPSHREPEVGP